uniref:NADH-ubiquinone oxidoreductase chain 4L n=1 Tax=Neocyema erythrosoma TaxID=2024705 RepID=A0A347ZJU0_9TELE|nr:NADH dehydrogenase subunit 4L [Neocyema erythrosoma]BBA85505.1 NADH dehydrogenase subunit 4L [Neocyema erythrosoma]
MLSLHLGIPLTFILAILGLALHRKYLLSALLCLEAMMLTLYLTAAINPLQTQAAMQSSTPIMILAFSACEATVGLALLVATSRTHGTTLLKMLNMLQC